MDDLAKTIELRRALATLKYHLGLCLRPLTLAWWSGGAYGGPIREGRRRLGYLTGWPDKITPGATFPGP